MTVEPEHITTEQAADIVDKTPREFRRWAKRHDIKPVGSARVGRSTHLLWLAADVYDATAGRGLVLLPVLDDTPTEHDPSHGIDNAPHDVAP